MKMRELKENKPFEFRIFVGIWETINLHFSCTMIVRVVENTILTNGYARSLNFFKLVSLKFSGQLI